MKSVLISIQPKWCELIASGKKTVEVRKTKPKLEMPFKVYIYCTIDGGVKGDMLVRSKLICGKVIGEFVCDAIFPMSILYSNPNDRLALREFPYTCLTDKEIMDYLGNGGEGYGWHISDLVIYDKPRELSDFCVWKKCNSCRDTGYESTACRYDEDCRVPAVITRPPQSWCYVERSENGKS
jgi:predicted transcriptional regulator